MHTSASLDFRRGLTLLPARIILLVILLSLSLPSSSSAPPASTPDEPTIPAPKARVQRLLGEAVSFEQAENLSDALDAASRAVAQASRSRDIPGEAASQAMRARLLARLDRKAEARDAWQSSAEAWRRAPDGPSEIEAWSNAAVLSVPDEKELADSAWNRCAEIGESERLRPRAAARALVDAGAGARKAGEFGAARKLLELARGTLKRVAPSSLDLANADIELANVEMSAPDGRRDVARELLTEALTSASDAALGSPEHVRALRGLARLAYTEEDFEGAAKLFGDLLALQDNIGSPPGEIAGTLSFLGVAEIQLGHYARAEQHQLRALAILEAQNPESETVSRELGNIGLNYLSRGDLDQARPYLERSLALQEKIANDPASVIPRLINLANVYNELLDIAKARAMYERVLTLCKEHAPDADPCGFALGNLRELEFRAGNRDAAERYGREALAFLESRDPESLDTSIEYIGMGNLERDAGRVASAEEYYRKALHIREKKVPGSPWVAECYHGLAEAARDRGDLAASRQLAEQAEAIYSSKEAGSSAAAENLELLGRIALDRADLENAEKYLRQSVAAWQELGGSDEPARTSPLAGLGEVLALEGRLDEAFEAALETERVAGSHLALVGGTIPERDALLFQESLARGADLAITLASVRRDARAVWTTRAWDAVVRSRLLVFDTVAQRHRRLAASGNPEARQLFDEVAATRERLARTVVRGPGDDAAAYETETKALTAEASKVEQQLVEKDEAFRLARTRRLAGLNDVRTALGPDDALVGFVQYARQPVRNDAKGVAPLAPEPLPSYAAFVSSAGRLPALVPLGAADEIDALVRQVRERIADVAKSDGRSGRVLERSYQKASAAIRERIIDPLRPVLGKVRRVFIVPDGTLNTIDFAALAEANGRYLVEGPMLLHLLATERDVIVGNESSGAGLLALGDPSFDRPAAAAEAVLAAVTAATPSAVVQTAGATYRGGVADCDGFRSVTFGPIPRTAEEVAGVKSIWLQDAPRSGSAVALTGSLASESAFKMLGPGREVLHLATHGFLMGAECFAASPEGTLSGPVTSGMALAGANLRGNAAPDQDDGILTAEEIASLDLRGTRWAVLSGCDSGLGRVQSGEGVLGLPRAFQIAGARTVIMSLWPVEDRWARQWMTALYESGVGKKRSTAEAVRDASLAVLRSRRAQKLDTNPFYWGAFVAIGDWR